MKVRLPIAWKVTRGKSQPSLKEEKTMKIDVNENAVVALVIILIASLLGAMGYAWYTYETNNRDHEHELRKIQVENCKMTPAQAEKLIKLPEKAVKSGDE